jgi:multiple sugar transport system substrate-binding protein
MKKKLISLLCLALIALAGVFGQTKKVELKFAWWGSQVRHEATIKVIELYQKLHPNVSISYEFAGFDDYWMKMTTMAAGGQLPDIMQQDYSRITEWQSRNLLEPLDPFVQNKTINLSDVAKPILDSGTINGKLYAICRIQFLRHDAGRRRLQKGRNPPAIAGLDLGRVRKNRPAAA